MNTMRLPCSALALAAVGMLGLVPGPAVAQALAPNSITEAFVLATRSMVRAAFSICGDAVIIDPKSSSPSALTR